MKDIRTLQPQALWEAFYGMTQTPRPSGHCEQVGQFLVNYGKALGLETIQDEIGNVLIRKPATPGYEQKPGIIMQAHMDMVPQKDDWSKHDFEKDPIEAQVDESGEWVIANGTTLGADNGIGVAAGLAILADKDLKHPALELFVTVDEETGMYGAYDLKPGVLQGEYLLNLDSETEGELYVGCAGGEDANITYDYQEVPVPAGDVAFEVELNGLHGGHSGCDIHLQRANANKLMFRFLKDVVSTTEARLASFKGGNMRNAIPRSAKAIVTVPKEDVDAFLEAVDEYESLFVIEYDGVETGITLKAKEAELPSGLLPEPVQDDLINAVVACPSGVLRMIPEMPDIVETSTNLSIIETTGTQVNICMLTRSSVESRKEEVAEMIDSLFSMSGARVQFDGAYPGWKPNFNSPLLDHMAATYRKLFDKEPRVVTIHAGLECAILGANYPKMQMISFGPTIEHPHSPTERTNIKTVEMFYDLLKATIESF